MTSTAFPNGKSGIGVKTLLLKVGRYCCGHHICVVPKDGSALSPHGPAAVHDEDVGGEAEDVGRVERQVLVVGTAAGGEGGVLANQ